MSLTSSALDAEIVCTADVVMVVVIRKSILLGVGGKECDLPGLTLLEFLASSPGRPLGDVVDEVARRTGADAGDVRAFADELLASGVLVHVGSGSPASNEEPSAYDVRHAQYDSSKPLVLMIPLTLRLGPHGFEELDHEGDVRARLSAVELAVAATFREESTFDEAFERQSTELGALALGREAFGELVERLSGARLLRAFDATDLAFRRGTTRMRAIQQWEKHGRDAVSAAIARETERLDKKENDRRARGLRARPKLIPACSQPTSWRMPPLSLGMVMAYAMDYKDGLLREQYDFRPDWLLSPEKVDAYAAEPGIYMFSSYLWSSERNLALSKRVKAKNPASVTIHGGPNTPKYEGDVERFFADHPHVDITVRGEGEATAAEILEALAGRLGDGPVDLSVLGDVPGLSYRAPDGTVVRTGNRDRLADLDVIPSPYLNGLFDTYADGWREVIAGSAGTNRFVTNLPAAIIETNRGCPYGCTFCDWGSATLSRIRQFDIDRVFAELDWCAEHGVHAVALADANFGIFARDVDITKKIAELKQTTGHPQHVGTNYAKNSTKHLKHIVETLVDADILGYGLLSLQSMDADTLNVIDRKNIKLEKYEELSKEFRQAQLPLYVDLMMGLPGQTLRGFTNDLQECANREVHAKVFPTILLPNSPMNEPNYRKLHGIETQPGERVLEAASFTRADYDDMWRLRRIFMVLEKYGVLRYVARYVRHETGIPELEFFQRLLASRLESPERWPLLTFTIDDLFRYMVPPISWQLLLGEVRGYVVEELGIADDDALDTVIEAQRALLPTRGREFPDTRHFAHDFVAWHVAMLRAKDDGHFSDWPAIVPKLRTFGSGALTVDDPRNVSLYELGVNIEEDPFDSWDMSSPVSRAVASQG